MNFFELAVGGAVGYALWKLVLEKRMASGAEGMGALPPMKSNRTYSHRVGKTPRSKATGRCVFGRGSTCRFPIGDVYHERKALQYVQAGRCASGDCEKILSTLARSAKDPEVKRRARTERKQLLNKAYRAKRKRSRTRSRKH